MEKNKQQTVISLMSPPKFTGMVTFKYVAKTLKNNVCQQVKTKSKEMQKQLYVIPKSNCEIDFSQNHEMILQSFQVFCMMGMVWNQS